MPPGNQIVHVRIPPPPLPVGSAFVRQAFAGNIIPASRFDSAAANVVKYYPLPNTAGNPNTGANNYYVASTSPETSITSMPRWTKIVNDHHRFFVRIAAAGSTILFRPITFPRTSRSRRAASISRDTFLNGALDYTYTLSAPRSSFGLRYGYGRAHRDPHPTQRRFRSRTPGHACVYARRQCADVSRLCRPPATLDWAMAAPRSGVRRGTTRTTIAMNNMKV